jgi:hypothetical protein
MTTSASINYLMRKRKKRAVTEAIWLYSRSGSRRQDEILVKGDPRMNLRLVSAAALVVSAMLLGAGVYESAVVAPNFQGAPTSLEHARGFYHATNPGTFFRVLSPARNFSSWWR